MAVIKIVPMPGAEGQKGDQGETGPAGATGATGPQGPAGGLSVSPLPPSHYGSPGDKVGDISFDDDHLYICVSDYINGSGIIWKRTNWNSGNW